MSAGSSGVATGYERDLLGCISSFDAENGALPHHKEQGLRRRSYGERSHVNREYGFKHPKSGA